MVKKIFCLEGMAGAGKTTQANKIKEIWDLMGYSSLIVNEKQYEPFKQTIINWHNQGANQYFSKKQIEEIAKSRAETHKTHFIPKLKELDYLLFDRSFYTSAVYQENGELTPQEIINLNIAEGSIIPEKGVILICSPEIAEIRINERRKKFNEYSLPSLQESILEISKRRELYIELAKNHSELYLCDTSNKKEDEIFQEIKFVFDII